MKIKFVFIVFFAFNNLVIAQDSNLFQRWYLYQLEADLEGVIWNIEEIQPEFLPSLTINSDLTFDGFGACNGFSGYYTYDSNQNSLFPNNVYFTLGNCDTNEELVFENLYFPYVDANTNHIINLTTNDNYIELKLENAPGYIATYRNVSLSISEDELVQISVYPNPVIDKLNISYDGTEALNITIYDVYGKFVFKEEFSKSSINISELTKGIYFLKVTTNTGIVIKKFIKE